MCHTTELTTRDGHPLLAPIHGLDNANPILPHTADDREGISLRKVYHNVLRLDSQRTHLSIRKGYRLASRSDKTGHSSGVSDHIPGIVIHDHMDHYITRKHLLGNLLLGSVLSLHDVSHGNADLENLVLQMPVFDRLFSMRFSFVLLP